MKAGNLLQVVAVFVLASSAFVQAQEKDLAWAVSQSPADAWVTISLQNLQQIQVNMKALAGITEPGKLDMLSEIGNSMPAAVDSMGSTVVIVTGEKPQVAIISRLKAGATLAGEAAEGGILKVAARNGEPVYAIKMEPWVMMAEKIATLQAVSAAPARMIVTPKQKIDINTRSMWISVNTKTLAAKLKASLPQDTAAGGGMTIPGMPDFAALGNWGVSTLNQIQSLVVAGDIKAEAASLTFNLDYAPGSQLAAMAGSAIPVASFKAGLPVSSQLILAGWTGMDWSKVIGPTRALCSPLLDAIIPASNAAAHKSMNDIWAMYDEWAKVLGTNVAMVMEPAPAGQGMYRLVETFTVKDADAFRKQMAKMMPLMTDLMKGFSSMSPMMPGANPAMKMEYSYKMNAETMEGLPVDLMKTTITFDTPAGTPPESQEQMKKMMDSMYGPEGMTMRIAIVDHTAVISMGGKETMSRAIKVARGQAPDLTTDAKVAAALARLPKNASFAALVSLPNYARMTMNMIQRSMAAAMGGNASASSPAKELPPGDFVTITGKTLGQTQSIELRVPQSEIRGMISVFEEGKANMMPAPGATSGGAEETDNSATKTSAPRAKTSKAPAKRAAK